VNSKETDMKTNKTTINCVLCGLPIKPNGGVETDHGAMHLICRANNRSSVLATHLTESTAIIQNESGRCEDAPCCGCCDDFSDIFYESDREIPKDIPVDLAEIKPEDIHLYDMRPIIIPDGFDISIGRNVPEIEDELNAHFNLPTEPDGKVILACCLESGEHVIRIFNLEE